MLWPYCLASITLATVYVRTHISSICRAIAESLRQNCGLEQSGPVEISQPRSTLTNEEVQLRLALELSQKESEESVRRRKEEEEQLEAILRLSLTDK